MEKFKRYREITIIQFFWGREKLSPLSRILVSCSVSCLLDRLKIKLSGLIVDDLIESNVIDNKLIDDDD